MGQGERTTKRKWHKDLGLWRGRLSPPTVSQVLSLTQLDNAFALVHLVGSEFARIALVVQNAQDIDSLVPINPEPFPQLGQADPQYASNFLPGFALRDEQDRCEPLEDTPVKRFLASSFEFPPLLRSQDNRFHGRMRW
jgi:hypothetical protein